MKKVIVLLAFAIVALSSCKKDAPYQMVGKPDVVTGKFAGNGAVVFQIPAVNDSLIVFVNQVRSIAHGSGTYTVNTSAPSGSTVELIATPSRSYAIVKIP